MGLGPFRSSSFCGCGNAKTQTPVAPKPPGNPDPTNYSIVETEQLGGFLIAMIDYPDCCNYEGRKILVFADVTEKQLRQQTRVDPHFCDKDHLSPIARFEPTDRGLQMAQKLVAQLVLT